VTYRHFKHFRNLQVTDFVVIMLALFSIALHLVFYSNLEYQRDELLYFCLGMHPDFGYATVPPLIGWVAWLIQNIFGYSVFAVRLFPALIGGAMVFIVSDLAKELGGNTYARIIAAVGIIIAPFGLRTFFLFQPVHLDVLFWTLTFYLIVKYINSENSKYLLWLGAVAGLSMLNKYLIGLLFMIILVVILFTRHRDIFRKKMFWFGIATGVLIFSPNLIWQIAHGLPVINHFSELAKTQLAHVSRWAFMVEQLINPGPASLLTVAGLGYVLFSKKQRKVRFLGIVVLAVICVLMLLRGKSYYTQGVFPFLIAAGAVFYESALLKWYSRTALAVILILIAFFILPFGLPVFKTDGLIKYFDRIESKYGFDFGRTFEDGSKHSLPQDFADMLGWEELTSVANEAWQMIPDKKAAFIYGENYGQAGAITIIGKKYGLPEAVSFSESFRYWIPHEFDPDITSLIYINGELGDDVKQLFRKISEIGKISNPDAREYGTTVYLCSDPVNSFNEFWKERTKDIFLHKNR
jgi:hypothetical protein